MHFSTHQYRVLNKAIAHYIITFFDDYFPTDVLLFGLETGFSVLVSTRILQVSPVSVQIPETGIGASLVLLTLADK